MISSTLKIVFLSIVFSLLTACGGGGSDGSSDNNKQEKIIEKVVDTKNSCTVSDFSLVKPLIAGKGHIIKLACKETYIALLMQKHSERYLEHNNVVLLDMSNNNVLFESSSNSVSDIQLSDDMALIYTDSSLVGFNQPHGRNGEYKLHYREMNTGETISKVIHQELYEFDYSPASLKVLAVGELWMTSYRKVDGSPWLSAWKLNQANEFEQVFEKQLAPNLVEGDFLYNINPIGGTVGALGQFTRQQFISLAENPVEKNQLLVSFSAPSGGVHDDTPLDYLDSFNILTDDDLAYISTRRNTRGVDVIVTKVDILGNQIGSEVLGTIDADEHFGLGSYQGKALIFGRARTSDTQWDAYIATPGMASSSFSLNSSSVMTAAIATEHGVLASGTIGWGQNPSGLSVSENADVELILVNDKLTELSKLTLASSARFDRVFGFMPLKKNVYLAYGMENGPGTHSADNDISKLVSAPLMMQVTIENDSSISHVVL